MTPFYFHPYGDVVSLQYPKHFRQYAKYKGAWYEVTITGAPSLYENRGCTAWREATYSETLRLESKVS